MYDVVTLFLQILTKLLFSGVADGVGGWRAYGIDPGEFSYHLMRTCEHLVRLGRFTPSNPSELIAKSYCELLHHKKTILGEFITQLYLNCVFSKNNFNCVL